MFQQWLGIFPAVRIYTGLYPFGGRTDPVRVKCSVCDFEEFAPDWSTATIRAHAHDSKHDNERRLDAATDTALDVRGDPGRL